MSTALAIAGVTAVLRDLLNDGLVNRNISGVLGSSVTVSVLAPDRVVPSGGAETSQINLFLYGVSPNPGWRNEALPSRDGAGRARLTNPPLALDLHYLLSAYSGGDLHAEILLGYAMQLLHEMPVLTRGPVNPITGRETGIAVQPGMAPAVPLLTAAVPPLRQPVAAIGDTVLLQGRLLDGTARSVRLHMDRFDLDLDLPVLAAQLPERPAATVAAFSLAGQQDALPAGSYRVVARLTRPDAQGADRLHETNSLVLTLAPRISNLPQTVARVPDGSATVTIDFTPALRAGQRALLVLGAAEYSPLAAGATPTSLAFLVPEAPVGVHLARLRIDGIDSPVIDMDFEPPEVPQFLNQTVEFT